MYTIDTSNKCITYHHYMYTIDTCESQFSSYTNVPPAGTQKRGGGNRAGWLIFGSPLYFSVHFHCLQGFFYISLATPLIHPPNPDHHHLSNQIRCYVAGRMQY